MNIKHELPPNYRKILEVLEPNDNTVFTYGDTIYAPYVTIDLPDDLIAHEKVHQTQQGENPDQWWQRYLVDKTFRFEQERQAYKIQYRVYRDNVKDKNLVARFAYQLAQDLSSAMYDHVINFNAAFEAITAL